MSFKIVQTIENGKFVISTVPETWEYQGILQWPKYRNEKLRRDPYSTPDDDWRSMNCIVKRDNLMSFEEAESEIRAMSNISDADQEIVMQHMTSVSRNVKNEPGTFNDLTSQCFATRVQIHKPRTIAPKVGSNTSKTVQQEHVKAYKRRKIVREIETEISKPEEIYKEQQQASTDTTHSNNDLLTATVRDLATNLSKIESKIDGFITSTHKNQRTLLENQQLIMQKLSDISIQFDEYAKRISSLHVSHTEEVNEKMKTIANEDNLNEFEESLKKKHFVDEMKNSYSVICGEGKGRAINNAYALIDAMFERNLLRQCSWAGGSRNEESKICFKSYKRTINLFFQIIQASDKQFTMLECESFFKNVLRNAKKRCESKQLKRSCQKRRPKKSAWGRKENEEIPVPPNKESGPSVSSSEHAHVNKEIPVHPIEDSELVNQESEHDTIYEQYGRARETTV